MSKIEIVKEYLNGELSWKETRIILKKIENDSNN
tara:strand:+ start:270 stop:371 length:102 start_codon:yes stop_codon:yes gene_type:complete